MTGSRQTAIPCTLMRGGTSKGPFFLMSDLPVDPALRDRVLLAVMGSPDARQIDGVGGAEPLTSKVAIVSKSTRPGIDVDYLFAQVGIDKALVDLSPESLDRAVKVASLPDLIRGYEDIKLRNVQTFRDEVRALGF